MLTPHASLFSGAVLALSAFISPTQAGYPYNGLAMTPQMGWDNWNAFGCAVSEDLLLSTASKIVDYGLRDVGYEYIVLDDCWSIPQRSDNGSLQWNETRFPNGMAHVADSIHDLGLKFGMYSSAGTYTCARYPGSLGYEKIDADTFAGWGVDYLKYDNCYNEGQSGTPLITYNRYKAMSDAINATGRPMLYSLCNWGEDFPWKYAQTISNSWRISGDIYDSFNRPDARCPCTGDEGWDCALPGFHCSMMNILNKVSGFVDKGIPGAWNDLDMLEVGNGGMSDTEYVSHFSMWAAVKSPLLMGNNINALTAKSLSILTNPAVLAVSQDPAGSSAVRRWRKFVTDSSAQDQYGLAQTHLWSGTLNGGDYLAVLLNGANTTMNMSATLEDIFVDSPDYAEQDWNIYDLWANRMPDDIAQALIDGNSTSTNATASLSQYYFNATKTSYAEGLASNDSLLLGTMVGSVTAGGSIETEVARHGVAMMRLRPAGSSLRKRDEL